MKEVFPIIRDKIVKVHIRIKVGVVFNVVIFFYDRIVVIIKSIENYPFLMVSLIKVL